MDLSEAVKQKAIELGFDLVGITDASAIEAGQVRRLAEWLEAGFAGQMAYMHRNFEKRVNAGRLLEGGESVICVGLGYKPATAAGSSTRQGRVAYYAQYEDYHQFIKTRLGKLREFTASVVGGEGRFKICVDSAPLAERALAVRAGLGFVGRNHMLINPVLGPEVLLGEIITNIKLRRDEPSEGNCSQCRGCIEACPTGALRADGQFDASRCISYLTIEHEGEIRPSLGEKMGTRLFGCDECVLACPYQQRAPVRRNEQFRFYGQRAALGLEAVLGMSEDAFESEFADSPIRGAGLERLKRNARICLANMR